MLFDDVERKVKPREDPYEYRKKLTLDAEKSKLSLADLYEQDYLKGLKGDEEEGPDVDTEAHRKIKAEMASLFNKLDHLSNHTFVPRPALPEVQLISNRNTVKVEEAGPLNLEVKADGESNTLAPEELSQKARADSNLMSREERSKTDKNRELRVKKARQKARAARMNGSEQKEAKVAIKNQKLTSTKFFTQMEQEKIMQPVKQQKAKKRAADARKAK